MASLPIPQVRGAIGALLAQLVYHLDQVGLISREIKKLMKRSTDGDGKSKWCAAPELHVRPAEGDSNRDMIQTRAYGARYWSTHYDTDHPIEGILVGSDRVIDWGTNNVPNYLPDRTISSPDKIKFTVAADYYEQYHQPNPDASSADSSRSRYRMAFAAARIFWKDCRLEHVQKDTVKSFRDWLTGYSARSPLGKKLPDPPVEKYNAQVEAARKANIILNGLDYWGARSGYNWSVQFRVQVVYPVGQKFHSRSNLSRIMWVLLTNTRLGYRVKGKPHLRWCPFEEKTFEYKIFKDPSDFNRNARRMLLRLIVLRYHLASRSIDCHSLGYAPSKNFGYIKLMPASDRDLTDLASGFVFRKGVVKPGQKGVADSKLMGKLASIATSWWRHDQREIKERRLRCNANLNIVRNLNGSVRGDYFRKFWREAQILAGVEPLTQHTLKRSGVTDRFYGGHSLEEIQDYNSTSQDTLRKVYRVVQGLKTYHGPAWQIGPGEPPPFRAELRKKARERGQPYPC